MTNQEKISALIDVIGELRSAQEMLEDIPEGSEYDALEQKITDIHWGISDVRASVQKVIEALK